MARAAQASRDLVPGVVGRQIVLVCEPDADAVQLVDEYILENGLEHMRKHHYPPPTEKEKKEFAGSVEHVKELVTAMDKVLGAKS